METGFYAEDLVDKYLPLHMIVSSSQKVVLTAIQVLRKSLKPSMLIVRLLQRTSLLPTILFVRLLRFVPIQDNIQLAQNHDAVDTVVEAVGYYR